MSSISGAGHQPDASLSTDQQSVQLFYGEQPPSSEPIIERDGQLGQYNVTLIMVTPNLLEKFDKEIKDLRENFCFWSPEKTLLFLAIGVCLCAIPVIGSWFLGFGLTTVLVTTFTCIPVAFAIPIIYCIYKERQITQYKDCFHTLQNHSEFLNNVIVNTLFGSDITHRLVKRKIDEFREKPVTLQENISTLVQLHGMCKRIVQLDADTRAKAKVEFAAITYFSNDTVESYKKHLEETPIGNEHWNLFQYLKKFPGLTTSGRPILKYSSNDDINAFCIANQNIDGLRYNYLNEMYSITLQILNIL